MNTTDEALFAGSGELVRRMREVDWATTPLGPVETWPQSLRTCVRIVLTSRQPMFVWWGEQLVNLYNDAYISILGGKHPGALGQPASEVWREIWQDIEPRAGKAMRENEGTFDEALLLVMDRNGYREETYYTFSYSPVPGDDGQPGGILCANSSDTQRIFGERQQATLREIAAHASHAQTVDEACTQAALALSKNPRDLPFALLYAVAGDTLRLVSAAGIPQDHPLVPAVITRRDACVFPVREVMDGHALSVGALRGLDLPTGAWAEPPQEAVAIGVRGADVTLSAILVIGKNPFRLLDDDYRRFLDLVAIQIGAAIGSAQSFAAERERADALAELDRAKTTFFSNISHEFRTPLTLMLGPTEDALRTPARALEGAGLESVYRNELRLLKLVNALLDFSRIEAGRIQAACVPTDLARLTQELTSAFRSAIESAGLRFDVACEETGDVLVDASMWEKIVLNLLSNALKFTFEGSVSVRLRRAKEAVELVVEDTGTGVSAEELPRLFERFHRVEGARSRTHEGSGIGLALTQDLVKLHGGTIEAESELGRGTRFTLRLPTDQPPSSTTSIPRSRAEVSSFAATSFAEEAHGWLRAAVSPADAPPDPGSGPRARLLVADDNADMRDYLARLLSARWDTVVVADGREALAAAHASPPDLVLTDVMMPNLDGFALLRALRAEPRLANIPVVLLSARAGDEARVEGIEAGADDYLIKPFSARELLARVTNLLALRRLQRELADERDRLAESRAEAMAANRAKDEFLAMLGHELRNPLAPIVTALELMRLRAPDVLQRERAVIERQTQHLAALLEDLLDVSRITRGMVELRRSPVLIADVLAKAVETAAPLFEQQRHQLVTQVPRDLSVHGDLSRLTQVFANLLTNAAKYTDPGGRVTVTAARDREDVVVTVSDTGVGISPEILPNVFGLFVQERQNLARSRSGLGLGLAIVKSLVELHGGKVKAESDGAGRGSTFTVRLPTHGSGAERAHRAASAAPPADTTGRRARSVLVVDDNADAAVMLADLLAARGYATRVAHDAPDALALAAEFVPDAAVLDIGLPAMDGYELARRLRAIPTWRDVKMVALTGYGQNADKSRAKDAGFDQHLVKPVDMKTLEEFLPPREE